VSSSEDDLAVAEYRPKWDGEPKAR
jgi:hypothetical protein